MADKTYKLEFGLSDGTTQEVRFTVPQGEAGKSAYQYAQEAGYTGTEAEFAAQLAGAAKIQAGSYVGTGYYSSTEQSLVFEFEPKLVIITGSYGFKSYVSGSEAYLRHCAIFLVGAEEKKLNAYGSTSTVTQLYYWCEGNTLYWYSANNTDTLNTNGETYHYVAFG